MMPEVLDLIAQIHASELDYILKSVSQRESKSNGRILNFLDLIYDMNGWHY